ncbi:MAG: radical SAM protein [Planctomycetota bacterium]|nr:MAG: radical SAM protein [Planctomycetota bacterium]
MRILVLQFVPRVRQKRAPRFEPQLGVLLSLLRQRGHELSLLGVTEYDEPALKRALADALPQLIYADISAVCVNAAQRCLQYISQHEFLPIVGGGELATLDPEACLSLPGVQAAALGEPDASLVTYLERTKDPAIRQIVRGIWLRDERGLERPALPPLVEDLDSLPQAERELFGYQDVVAATGQIEIAVGRGCPQRCGYCPLPTVAQLYSDAAPWVRRRSPDNVLDEIDRLRSTYSPVRLVRFLDHAFTLDAAWLEAFLDAYQQRCDVPFRCHCRANRCDEALARRLASAGCAMADVEVISASDFIRNEIFAMDLSREQIDACFSALRAANIRTRAIVYAGAPYESEASLDEIPALLRAIAPDLVDVRPYYPFPGTAGRETARENGWLHAGGEEQFHRGETGLNIPACRPQRVHALVRRVRREFPTELAEPWWRRASRSALTQFFTRRR